MIELKSKRICLIGLSKNAGKTTALNYLLNRSDCDEGVVSIGRDGEQTDEVYGFNKPRVFVKSGTYVATAINAIKNCTCSREILAFCGVYSAFGEVYVFRAKTDGFVELCGSGELIGLDKTISVLNKCGAKRVYIDGAFSRKTLASDSVILVVGASYSVDMQRTIDEAEYIVSQFFLHLSEVKDRVFEIEGALTDTVVDNIISKNEAGTIIVKSLANILINLNKMQLLLKLGINIKTKIETKLLSVFYNPFSPLGYNYNKEEFKNRLIMRLKKYNVPIFNAMEEN